MIETICGETGGGKSYWGVERCVAHIALGGVVVTNLPFIGLVDTGASDLERWAVGPDAPIRAWLRDIHKWEYQDGQLRFIDEETILGNWLPLIPKGTKEKHVLFVFDECADQFDSLDQQRLRQKDDYYRKLFEFLRKHRHYHVDVILLLQSYSTMNTRLRDLSKYVYKTVDMEGRGLFGLPFKCPLAVFNRFQFDRAGKLLLKRWFEPKCKGIFALYDSYNEIGDFGLASGVKTDYGASGAVRKVRAKMTWFDRVGIVVAFLAVCWLASRGREKGGRAGVVVVTVTNTVERVAGPLVASSGASGVSAAVVASDGLRVRGPRVSCEYLPISFGQAGADTWAYCGGKLYRVGMSVPQGRVVEVARWGVRIVGPDGEHFIYHLDRTYMDSGELVQPEALRVVRE